MENYLIPANSKKSQLIFSLFRTVDLVILLIGGIITLTLMFVVSGDTILSMIIKLLPIATALLLVLPIPYYHNVLVFLQEFTDYIFGQKIYHWRGWCSRYGFDDTKQN